MIKRVYNPEEMDKLQQQLIDDESYQYKGAESGISHLKSALYDWRVEEQWGKDNSYVFEYGDKQGFIFFTITQREPIHCTLRHIFVIEGNRGLRIGEQLYNKMIEVLSEIENIRLRMFINKPAVGFYEKFNIKEYHGKSKTGLPFYYGDLNGNLIKLPKAQIRYVNSDLHEINIDNNQQLLNNLF